MIKKRVTPKEAVNFLNELLRINRRVIESLFNIRMPCNRTLAFHPTVQVGAFGKKYYIVGFLGIINGLFGIDKDGWGCICMDVSKAGRIERFRIVEKKDKGNL